VNQGEIFYDQRFESDPLRYGATRDEDGFQQTVGSNPGYSDRIQPNPTGFG